MCISHLIMQAVRKDGTDRVKTECDRGGQTWRPRKVLEPKNTEWMDEIAKTVLQVGLLLLIILCIIISPSSVSRLASCLV